MITSTSRGGRASAGSVVWRGAGTAPAVAAPVRPADRASGVTTRVLVVEDTPEIARLIQKGLMLDGYHVDLAADGCAALAAVRDRAPDVMVLDLMLPDIDGLEVCRRVRAAEDSTGAPPMPILMLTALDAIRDRVNGLNAGADDYLNKPFAHAELSARIRALLRRSSAHPDAEPRGTPQAPLSYDDLTLDPSSRIVTRGERRVVLTAREFDLLHMFIRHPNQVLTHDTLMERVWGDDFFGESNVLAVTIASVRRSLEEGGEPRLIQTVRGVGYVLRSTP
ncbi:MAG: response regulator transcription factor [Chloroflexota bacterium]